MFATCILTRLTRGIDSCADASRTTQVTVGGHHRNSARATRATLSVHVIRWTLESLHAYLQYFYGLDLTLDPCRLFAFDGACGADPRKDNEQLIAHSSNCNPMDMNKNAPRDPTIPVSMSECSSSQLDEVLASWQADPDMDELLHTLLRPSGMDGGGWEESRGSLSSTVTRVSSPLPTTSRSTTVTNVNASTRHVVPADTSNAAPRVYLRPKEEMMWLRRKVHELELQLRVLRNRQQDGAQGSISARESHHPNTKVDSLWRDIAVRQSQRQHEAELENAQLRVSIITHETMIKRFQRFIERGASSVQETEPQLNRNLFADIVDHDPAVKTSTCQALLHLVAEMYTNVDRDVTRDVPFVTRDGAFSEVIYGEGNTGGGLPGVALLERRIVPFEMQQTAKAIWQHHAWRSTAQGNFPFSELVSEDTMIKGFQLTLATAVYAGPVQGMIVGRIYTESDRAVIVWAAELDFPVQAAIPLRLIQGWTVIRHASACAGKSESAGAHSLFGTQIEAKHVVRPTSAIQISAEAMHSMTSLVDFVSQCVAHHHEKILRSIDRKCLPLLLFEKNADVTINTAT